MSGLQTNTATRPPSGLTAAAVHTKHGLLKRSESSVLFYMELDGCFGTASPGGHMRDALCFLTLLIWQNAPSLALYWHICSECLCLRRDGGDFTPFSAVVAVHFHHSTASPVVLLDHLSTACIFQIQYEINPQTYCHITVSKSE